MKLLPTTPQSHPDCYHTRTLLATDLKTTHRDDPKELLITIHYTGEGNAAKAIPLDNEIIPAIVGAVQLLPVLAARLEFALHTLRLAQDWNASDKLKLRLARPRMRMLDAREEKLKNAIARLTTGEE